MEKDSRPQRARSMVEARRLGRRQGRGFQSAGLVVVSGLVADAENTAVLQRWLEGGGRMIG